MTLPINVIFGHLQVRKEQTAERYQCTRDAVQCFFPLTRSQNVFFLVLCIYIYMQKKTRVRIWLYEDARQIIEGCIIGFDEYMNMVLDEAVEMDSKKNTRTVIGRILLKGDSITLIQ